MRIVYIKLVNFIGVHAAMGLKEVEFSFGDVDKPIIQIYGRNRCGKTVLIHQLHPFSNIDLNGDERSDLSLIIPGEVGLKNIVYEVDGDLYNITHTYKPTRTSHSISSSLLKNGEELNPSGGVTIFNNLVEKILGINKYTFQLICNGTQLTSFANMSTTQRKNLLNKAMGIDIYDKIHKLATDDYRYTNKLITSLSNTKEFILSTYGSYENLCTMMSSKQNEVDSLSKSIDMTRSRMDQLSGEISVIRNQNVQQELMDVNNNLTAYKNVINELGSYDPDMYDKLVEEQISLNNSLSTLKNERLLIRKDKDVLYGKKTDIQNTMMNSRRASNDYDNMVRMKEDLVNKIGNINVETNVSSSSSYYKNMISLGQVINDTCTEILSCLNHNHLQMFTEMVTKGIDISAFLIQEGSVLMDTEKERSAITRIRSMINSIQGKYPDDECGVDDCIYKKTHQMLDSYFKSYQSTSDSQFTQYDLEQIDHANKNVQTIRRLISTEIPDELKMAFSIETIMENISMNKMGVDVSYVKYLMEEAAKIEQRTQYISQLSEIERSIENMKKLLLPTDDMDEMIRNIDEQINELNQKDYSINNEINKLSNMLDNNDKHRLMLSQVKHIDVDELNKRHVRLTTLLQKLQTSESEYNELMSSYNNMTSQMNMLTNELKVLTDAFNQYTRTVAEITAHDEENGKYKIIAEATSSTKGKPVIAIRDTVEDALSLTNRLLDIMYDGEIELLSPTINEDSFALPFRCGSHMSSDIRYGSQSESTLLSLALELSLSSALSKYNVYLIDECDGYLDAELSESYVMMLYNMMSVLKVEQCFMISHHVTDNSCSNIIHVLNLSEEIKKESEK